MVKIEGVERVIAKLKFSEQQAKNDNESAVVGYTQSYAIYVHENLDAHHAEGKQAKFLETPARELAPELARIVADTYKKTKSMSKGLLVAAFRLLRASQEIVPIDTGALKASGFASYQKDEEQAAQAAYAASQAIKEASKKR